MKRFILLMVVAGLGCSESASSLPEQNGTKADNTRMTDAGTGSSTGWCSADNLVFTDGQTLSDEIRGAFNPDMIADDTFSVGYALHGKLSGESLSLRSFPAWDMTPGHLLGREDDALYATIHGIPTEAHTDFLVRRYEVAKELFEAMTEANHDEQEVGGGSFNPIRKIQTRKSLEGRFLCKKTFFPENDPNGEDALYACEISGLSANTLVTYEDANGIFCP